MTANSFLTADGLVVPAVTAAEMREVDRIAIEETGPNLYQMMENAGRNLALTAIEMLGHDWHRSPIVVWLAPAATAVAVSAPADISPIGVLM